METNHLFARTKVFIAVLLLAACPASGSYFKMEVRQVSINTPGRMELAASLTDRVTLRADYTFRVAVYVNNTLVRKTTLPVTKTSPASFDMEFPGVRSRTEARCRLELFLNGQFLEGRSAPLTLWPPAEPWPEPAQEKSIAVFDLSGKVQRSLGQRDIKVIDATFQPARQFGEPDIIFIGQNTQPEHMVRAKERMKLASSGGVIVFLKQHNLPEDANAMVPEEGNVARCVSCDVNSPLLDDLSRRDIMDMVQDAHYIKIKKPEENQCSVNSVVCETTNDPNYLYSYLAVHKCPEQYRIYCQLPVTDEQNPLNDALLGNLLECAYNVSEQETMYFDPHKKR